LLVIKKKKSASSYWTWVHVQQYLEYCDFQIFSCWQYLIMQVYYLVVSIYHFHLLQRTRHVYYMTF